MSEIKYLNRYSGEIETEAIYGEAYLRWTYESSLGKIALWVLLRRAFFSVWYGWRMSRAVSRNRVAPFIKNFSLDTGEFEAEADSYETFNDFFYRRLKPEARPLVGDERSVAFAADGRHFAIRNIDETQTIYAKGQRFSVEGLLGDQGLARAFAGGCAIISRLCPVDYHRFHSPVSGRIVSQQLIGGDLYSVNPIALSQKIDYLWRNKRILTIIDTEKFGRVAYVAIGATCVGSIRMTAQAETSIEKGDELGFFEFGGSCVITVYESGKIELAEDLSYAAQRGWELYAQVRDESARGF